MSLGRPWRRGTRRDLRVGALVLLGLVVFVLLTYVAIVVVGGALSGHLSSPQLGLSVLATAVVALSFDPVQRRLEKTASAWVEGGRPSPYEVLRHFSETVTGSCPSEQLPDRMARVLAEGTGAEWAQVWVTVGDHPVLAATWPPSAAARGAGDAPPTAAREREVRSMSVHHRGELLGLLVVNLRDGVELTSVEERLFAGLASQAGLVLRGTALRVELGRRLAELAARADELRASRQRVVDAQDEARRLLERDIHDGAQQHLVALSVNLRLAHGLSLDSADECHELLAGQRGAALEAIATLVRLSQGIYPPLLAEDGLTAALRSALETSAIPVHIDSTDVGRYAEDVEAAAYFCTLEAVQNAGKHSGAPDVRLSLRGDPGALSILVEDDGAGFLQPGTADGDGLVNMRDRVESIGGALSVTSAPGAGTQIEVRLPATSRRVAADLVG